MKVTFDGVTYEATIEEFKAMGIKFPDEPKKGSTVEFVNILSTRKDYETVRTGSFPWESKQVLSSVTFEIEIMFKYGLFMKTEFTCKSSLIDKLDREKKGIREYVKELFV